MPTVYVNDKPVEIGTAKLNCVQAAELAGVFVPHYCWHPALSVVASLPHVPGRGRRPQGRQGDHAAEGRARLPDAGQGRHRHRHRRVRQARPGAARPALRPRLHEGRARRPGEEVAGRHARRPAPQPPARLPGVRQGRRVQAAGLQLRVRPRREPDGRREEHAAEQAGHLSSKITLFTDRCIMCTRCVRFTREISGTAELQVIGRGHHAEIDVFPGAPLENKLAGNVVDLCPVGALGSKDFLYKQRVWYLKTTDSVCPAVQHRLQHPRRCEQGHRLPPAAAGEPAGAGALHVRRGPVRLPLRQLGERFTRPAASRPTASSSRRRGATLVPQLQAGVRRRGAAERRAASSRCCRRSSRSRKRSCSARYFKALSQDVRLVLGPVPVVGEDDTYPKDAKGEPVEPVKFTIRAEKCPNRLGVEAVLKHFQGEVIPFASVAGESLAAMWFAGGYPDPAHARRAHSDRLEGAGAAGRAGPVADGADRGREVRPAGDDRRSRRTARSSTTPGWPRRSRGPCSRRRKSRTEVQVAFDLLGRRGLVQPAAVRKELAKAVPYFAALAERSCRSGERRVRVGDACE